MAGQNDFKIFDENKENMLAQDLYEADDDRVDGFKKGLARSNVTNKALHQATMMAHAIGEIAADNDLNASDEGSVDDLKETLKEAFGGANRDLSNLTSEGEEHFAGREYTDKIINRIYDGVDLSVKFADEIANFTSVWAWFQDRVNNGNYEGILVGDYIPVTFGGSTALGTLSTQTYHCQIVGIDTWTGATDLNIGHDVVFDSKEVMPLEIKWQPNSNNNGTSVQNNPFLSSIPYAWLNGVNNYTTSAYKNVAHGANCNNNGVFQLLPVELRNVIAEERELMDDRYSASGLLTCSTSYSWKNKGKLSLPSEVNVYGAQERQVVGQTTGWWNPEGGVFFGYPHYLGSVRNRIKVIAGTNTRSTWWLSSVESASTASVCIVNGGGLASSSLATGAGVRCPLHFHIRQQS